MALKKKYAGKIDFIRVNTSKEESQVLIQQYDVNLIPAFYFLGKNGAKIDSAEGEMSQAQLESRLENLLKNYR